MKISAHTSKHFVIAILLFVTTSVAHASIWTPATLTNPPDNFGANPKNPFIKIKQRLPVGDTMTATLTWDKNQVITNGDGSTPTYSGTVGQGTDGLSFIVPGVVNGKVVTDIHQTHTDPRIPSGTLEVAAFQNINGNLQAAGLGSWLLGNMPTVRVPDFLSPTSMLFYGVDLTVWAPNSPSARNFTIGQSFNILNGISASLPGFIFSTTPLSVDSTGWSSNSLYSGVVNMDSFHEFSVPEPAGWALFAFSIFAAFTRRRIAVSTTGKH